MTRTRGIFQIIWTETLCALQGKLDDGANRGYTEYRINDVPNEDNSVNEGVGYKDVKDFWCAYFDWLKDEDEKESLIRGQRMKIVDLQAALDAKKTELSFALIELKLKKKEIKGMKRELYGVRRRMQIFGASYEELVAALVADLVAAFAVALVVILFVHAKLEVLGLGIGLGSETELEVGFGLETDLEECFGPDVDLEFHLQALCNYFSCVKVFGTCYTYWLAPFFPLLSHL
ncbi:hypothetical protein RIF29_09139 [Crotalaria pallida]|uniref:Uncharacterized protein n=1 Tax=Crotalaria pallida TaxID=3830 RepID=A0AAN9FUL4_CROPI